MTITLIIGLALIWLVSLVLAFWLGCVLGRDDPLPSYHCRSRMYDADEGNAQ
jgi:hypothetical protein